MTKMLAHEQQVSMSLMYLPHLDVFCDLLERLPPVKLISNQDKILWKTLLRRNVFKNSQRKGVVVGEEENSSSFFQFSRSALVLARSPHSRFRRCLWKERKNNNNKTSVYRLGHTGRLCPKGMPFFSGFRWGFHHRSIWKRKRQSVIKGPIRLTGAFKKSGENVLVLSVIYSYFKNSAFAAVNWVKREAKF